MTDTAPQPGLRPLTDSVPKPMLPVGHVPMIARLIGRLGRGGATEVVLALGFKPEPFVKAFPDGRCGDVVLRYAVEPEPLDTGGAIRFAAAEAGRLDRLARNASTSILARDTARRLVSEVEDLAGSSSYADVARAIGRPKSARPTGGAVGANPLPIIVPCHRVIGSDQSLTGFTGGLSIKVALLELEGRLIEE